MDKISAFFKNTADTIKSYVTPSPQSQEDINKIQAERKVYYDDIKAFQEKVASDINDKISPETGIELNALIKSAQEWLKNNPNASYLEVNNQHVNFPKLYEPIYEREVPKNRLLFFIYIMQYYSNLYLGFATNGDRGTTLPEPLKSDMFTFANSSLSILNTGLSWYQKNPKEDGIVYTQEIDKLTASIVKLAILLEAKHIQFKDDLSKLIKNVSSGVKEDKKPRPWTMKDEIAKNKATKQALDANQFNNTKLISDSTSIGLSIFGSLLLVVIILYGASLAANMAIGRSIQYRIFYFIFGCNPLLTPIIFAYTALMALKGHAIPYYGILPISTEPATTRLGKIVWYPFFYIGDQFEEKSKADFGESLTKIAKAVMSMPKPDAIQI